MEREIEVGRRIVRGLWVRPTGSVSRCASLRLLSRSPPLSIQATQEQLVIAAYDAMHMGKKRWILLGFWAWVARKTNLSDEASDGEKRWIHEHCTAVLGACT